MPKIASSAYLVSVLVENINVLFANDTLLFMTTLNKTFVFLSKMETRCADLTILTTNGVRIVAPVRDKNGQLFWTILDRYFRSEGMRCMVNAK